MAARYRLKQRAERQEETRQRIVEAAVALHSTVGPLRTTDSAIAEKAGVTRVTFYRHFPDDVSLFRACTAHGMRTLPPPDPDAWRHITDPEARLRTALQEVYAYFRVAGPGLLVIARDVADLSPEVRAIPSRMDILRTMGPVLAAGWPGSGRDAEIRRAAIEHALAVTTWQSLVQRGRLEDEEAVELLVELVRGAHAPAAGRVSAPPGM